MPESFFVGKKQPRWINPQHIVELRLVKSRKAVHMSGDTDGDTIVVDNIMVKEPYAIEITTINNKTHYRNFNNKREAIRDLADMIYCITGKTLTAKDLTETLERIYGQEQEADE